MSDCVAAQSRLDVGGVKFSISSLPDAVRNTIKDAEEGRAVAIRLSNAYCVSLAYRDQSYRELLNGPGITYPDGAPVAVVMRLKQAGSRVANAGRVRGPSFFRETLSASQTSPHVSHFFLGGTEESIRDLVNVVSERYPGVKVAGFYAPPFGPVSDELVSDSARRIARSGASMVWLGLGTPKQDVLAAQLVEKVGVPCAGVGAAFDYLSGRLYEAPPWVQRSGFEWVFRLLIEPRRLWKRYFVGNTLFLLAILRGPQS